MMMTKVLTVTTLIRQHQKLATKIMKTVMIFLRLTLIIIWNELWSLQKISATNIATHRWLAMNTVFAQALIEKKTIIMVKRSVKIEIKLKYSINFTIVPLRIIWSSWASKWRQAFYVRNLQVWWKQQAKIRSRNLSHTGQKWAKNLLAWWMRR